VIIRLWIVFWGSLKSERLGAYRFIGRRVADIEILDYITCYNDDRIRSKTHAIG